MYQREIESSGGGANEDDGEGGRMYTARVCLGMGRREDERDEVDGRSGE